MSLGWVISLAAGASQVPFIAAAKTVGARVIAVDRDAAAPGLALVDDCIVASTYDSTGVVAALSARGHYYRALLARTSGPALATAALISETFGLAGPDSRLVELATSKSALREFGNNHLIPMPAGYRIEAGNAARRIPQGAVVVKPDLPTRGKAGICLVRESRGRAAAISSASRHSSNGAVEVQEYVEGTDVVYLAWLDRGRMDVLLSWDELNFFSADGTVDTLGAAMPSSVAGSRAEEQIVNVIRRFARLFDTARALLAFSFRVDCDGRISMIEIHADLTGDSILDDLAPAATGESVVVRVVRLLTLGEVFHYSPESIVPTALFLSSTGTELITTHSRAELAALIACRSRAAVDRGN